MNVETTSKRLIVHVGDKVIVIDINICQRVLPAIVEFKGIEQVVKVDESQGIVSVDLPLPGYEEDYYTFFEPGADFIAIKREVALEVADSLSDDGVTVIGRPPT